MGGRMPPKSAWFGPAMLAMISVPFDVFFDEFSLIIEKRGGGGDQSCFWSMVLLFYYPQMWQLSIVDSARFST